MCTGSNRSFVFVGPTLPVHEVRELLDAVYLPPVAQGDVLRAAQLKPKAIGIIDGFFERVPAVWHKEILWAMGQGIHVFGSASIGALRAAELHPFGMVGVGRIFEAFRDGVLEDDDEVALIHGPTESGYRPMSVPMVNIRRSLSDAVKAGVIGERTGEGLLRVAKSLHYAERDYPRIARQAALGGFPAGELADLLAWVERQGADQKREDAVEMLGAMKTVLSNDNGPRRVNYRMEHTDCFAYLQTRVGKIVSRGGSDFSALQSDAVLDELRLHPETYDEIVGETVTRKLVVGESQRHQWPARDELVAEILNRFQRDQGIADESSYHNWLQLNDTSDTEFSALIRERAIEQDFGSVLSRGLESDCLDTLRLRNEYFKWIQRYERKRAYLEQKGLTNPSFDQVRCTEQDVLAWYFREQGLLVPAEIRSYAVARGFRDEHVFLQSILMEYIYCHRL